MFFFYIFMFTIMAKQITVETYEELVSLDNDVNGQLN